MFEDNSEDAFDVEIDPPAEFTLFGAAQQAESFDLETGRFRSHRDGRFNDGRAEDFDFETRRFRDEEGRFTETPSEPERARDDAGLFKLL